MIYAVNTRTKEHRVPKNPEMATPGEVVDGKKYGDKWLMVEADADGWIEWRGGECPLPDGAHASVLYANGRKKTGKALNPNHNMEQSFWTRDYGNSWNIIAYRPILDTNPSEPEAPEWDGGLPPVGCECEYYDAIQKKWMPASIVAHHINGEEAIWSESLDGGDLFYGTHHDFRPLRSAEDRLIDEALDTLEADGDDKRTIYSTVARMICHGYRKTGGE